MIKTKREDIKLLDLIIIWRQTGRHSDGRTEWTGKQTREPFDTAIEKRKFHVLIL